MDLAELASDLVVSATMVSRATACSWNVMTNLSLRSGRMHSSARIAVGIYALGSLSARGTLGTSLMNCRHQWSRAGSIRESKTQQPTCLYCLRLHDSGGCRHGLAAAQS